jgi:DNA repair exonuclease SbcCD nuclease subunit
MITNSTSPEPSQAAPFKIGIFTDNHLGYKENHHIRGSDSFVALEECLDICSSEKVDFVIHAGDLFHEPTPSQPTMLKAMQIFQKYTFGSRPIQFGIRNYQNPNFFSENININLPIFAIHGKFLFG